MAPSEAMVLARMAGGSRKRFETADANSWIQNRDWLIDRLEALSEMPVGVMLLLAERLASRKEDLTDFLEMIKIWFRDLVVYPHAPDRIVNLDLTEKIRQSSRRFSADALLAKMDAVEAAERSLERNGNPRLTLEKMILQISKS